MKSFLIRVARVSGNTFFFSGLVYFCILFSLFCSLFFKFFLYRLFIFFVSLFWFIYLFVFLLFLIENFPLKNIVRFNVARRYFVVDKKKTFTGQIAWTSTILRRNRNFYPKSRLLSSFSSTENAHFYYFDLARKLWAKNIVPNV